jgi:His Kinase A (phospho-acceptor) domain
MSVTSSPVIPNEARNLSFSPRQKIYFAIATAIFSIHIIVAVFGKASFPLTMFGDAIPCVFLLLAILAMWENLRNAPGVLPVFWKVFAGGLAIMFCSEAYWFYYDWRRLTSAPSPVAGDSLFLLAHVFVLSALALRPHSASAGRDLCIRSLDFVLLCCWWLCLYGYFALPWQFVFRDFAHYNPAYYLLAFLQHLVIIAALIVLAVRKKSAWRAFYFQVMLAFVLIAAGNLILSMAIDGGSYYAGSFYDTPFFLALYIFVWIACFGARLQPFEDPAPDRELVQSIWTARVAMIVMLSLPLIALWGLTGKALPPGIETFRLRLIFASMFVLGALVYLKLSLLLRELVALVHLSRHSVESLQSVQQQITHSQKIVALGRLAAGAAHEISNPLTAILGYSELLADIPSLTAEDRAHAQTIRQQVHRAQAAVISLRNTMRRSSPGTVGLIDKKAES